jgi:hypothetical protein
MHVLLSPPPLAIHNRLVDFLPAAMASEASSLQTGQLGGPATGGATTEEVAAVPDYRALKLPIAAPTGWQLDALDLSGKPFTFTLPPSALPGLAFRELIGWGSEGCVYGGAYLGHPVAVKVGLAFGPEVALLAKAAAMHLAPRLLASAELPRDAKYTDYGEEDKRNIVKGGDLGVTVIVMERFDVDLEEFCADPELVARHGAAVLSAAATLLLETAPAALFDHGDLGLYNLVARFGEGGKVTVRFIDLATAEFGAAVGGEDKRESIRQQNSCLLQQLQTAMGTVSLEDGAAVVSRLHS